MEMDFLDFSHVKISSTLQRIFADSKLSLSGALAVVIPLFMGETRSSVLLKRLARKMRKETGDQRYRARVEDELPSLRSLMFVSATRPLCKLRLGLALVKLMRCLRLDFYRAYSSKLQRMSY